MHKVTRIIILSMFVMTASVTFGQGDAPTWRRNNRPDDIPMNLFHSTQAINLPTTEMLGKETFEFEIAHRFYPLVKDGQKELFGFDGPATIRFALAYGISNSLTLALGRSNLDDNVDLNLKLRAMELARSLLPIVIAMQAGTGWNTQVRSLSQTDSRSFQHYGRVIINTMIYRKFGFGVAPTYLYNTNVRSAKIQEILTVGINIQYYISGSFSVLAEWNPRVAGDNSLYNPVSYGIELETGGHFFKFILSNSIRLNPSQYIAGSDDPAGGSNWHLGFNITRLLRFW